MLASTIAKIKDRRTATLNLIIKKYSKREIRKAELK